MPVSLSKRDDINLDTVFRVAWKKDTVEIGEKALQRIAVAVAAMLDGEPMPAVPASGQGGAGEILALYPLFAELSTRFDLEVKERGSLINGSPCAAALVADAALAARRRIRMAHQV
ncbi:MAG: histidine ammonia-lyase, partial [Mesorhizobium sp.]